MMSELKRGCRDSARKWTYIMSNAICAQTPVCTAILSRLVRIALIIRESFAVDLAAATENVPQGCAVAARRLSFAGVAGPAASQTATGTGPCLSDHRYRIALAAVDSHHLGCADGLDGALPASGSQGRRERAGHSQ